MTYASWNHRYHVTSIEPGRYDLLIETTINGVRASIDAATEYDRVMELARGFSARRSCHVRVVPIAGPEIAGRLGLTATGTMEQPSAGGRRWAVETLMDVVRESADPDARGDALDLLTEWGVIRREG